MRIRKLSAYLILVCVLLSTTSLPARAEAIQSGNRISATIDDWRQVAAGYAALESEVAVLHKSLAEERQKMMEVITTTQDLRESDAKEIELLKEQVGIVGKAKYKEGRADGLKIGSIIGFVIGAGTMLAVHK